MHANISQDYVKPKVKLIGEDGNVFNLLAKCTSALKAAGVRDKAAELADAVYASSSYDEALALMMEYVEVY